MGLTLLPYNETAPDRLAGSSPIPEWLFLWAAIFLREEYPEISLLLPTSAVWVFSATNQLLLPTCVALGNFDGVHLGHQTILRALMETSARVGGHSAVVSFNPHPRSFFPVSPNPCSRPRRKRSPCSRNWESNNSFCYPLTKT